MAAAIGRPESPGARLGGEAPPSEPEDGGGGEPRAGGGGGPRRPPAARSDLGGRVLVAVPAVAFAIFIVSQGGLVFALALLALGFFCLHELYAMTREHAARSSSPGFLGLIALVMAALYGGQFQLVLVQVALAPVMFALAGPAAATGRRRSGWR